MASLSDFVGGSGAALLAVIQEQMASGSSPGAPTSGTWVVRNLNTEVSDPDGIVALASKVFTPSVDCGVTWFARAHNAGGNQTKLVRTSDSSVIGIGTSSSHQTSGNDGSLSTGAARLSAGVSYRLEHYIGAGVTNALGAPSNSGAGEVYSQVAFWS